jgi:uncharacterized membrane protein YdjX (TVP38/TMEM64 family)
MRNDGAASANSRGRRLERLAPAAVILVALLAFFAFDIDRLFTIEALRENRAFLLEQVESNFPLAVAAFVGAYALATAISFPGASALTIFGGFLFGLWTGTTAVVAAATTGALVIYAVARTSVGAQLRGRAGGFLARMETGFRENELSYMLLLRLVPIFPFWAINIVSGILNVRPRNFIIGTLFGIIPGTIVYVSIGHGLGSVFDEGGEITLRGALFRPETLLPMVGLAALAAAPIIWKRIKDPNAKRERP